MNYTPEGPRPDDPADNLEEPLRRVVERICNRPVSADSLHRALERANQLSGGVPHPPHRLFVASLKVAAAVLVAATLWWLWPTEGWTRVDEAGRTRPWIHGISRQPDGATGELWFSASRDVSASRHGDWVTYMDHRLNIRCRHGDTHAQEVLERWGMTLVQGKEYAAGVGEAQSVLAAYANRDGGEKQLPA